jgi:Ca2+-binding EF-hand superfamily protein
MTPATCAAFTRSCTDDNCQEDDNRVTGLFALYDANHDNKIEVEDFLNFYTQCSREKEDVVRQNLYA